MAKGNRNRDRAETDVKKLREYGRELKIHSD